MHAVWVTGEGCPGFHSLSYSRILKNYSPSLITSNFAIDLTMSLVAFPIVKASRKIQSKIFHELDCPVLLNFDLTGLSQQEAKTFSHRLFNSASQEYMVNFHILLISRLRQSWAMKAERCLKSFLNRMPVGLHLRTGNGEIGDFINKQRQVDIRRIIDSFLSEIESRADAHQLLIFVASNDFRVYECLIADGRFDVVKFTEYLPTSGVATGNWNSPESDPLGTLEQRT